MSWSLLHPVFFKGDPFCIIISIIVYFYLPPTNGGSYTRIIITKGVKMRQNM